MLVLLSRTFFFFFKFVNTLKAPTFPWESWMPHLWPNLNLNSIFMRILTF